jgi:outer membrane protein
MTTQTRLKALALALMTALAAAPAAAEDLVQLYRIAREQDATLAAARAAWQAAQEKLPQAEAGLRPQASAGASANYVVPYSRTDSSPPIYQTNSNWTANASVSASQPLYRQQDLILRLAQAYFDVLLADDTLQLTRAAKDAFAEQLAQAKRNFEVGTATITDTNEAQARYDQAAANEIAATNDLDIRRRALELIIGQPAPLLKPLSSDPPLVLPDPPSLEAWGQRAEAGNYTLLIARLAADVAALEVDRNQAAYSPTVDLVGAVSATHGAGLSAVGISAFDTLNTSVGVVLNWPLYTGGLYESRTREAYANRDRARQDVEGARRLASQGARALYASVVSGAAQVGAQQQVLRSNETALQSSIIGKDVGVRTQVDVLNAQQNVFVARRDLAKARYDFLVNWLRLKAAVGALDEADLASVNRALGS